jgi:DNA invertase Pin-like site-specific DNA recombinase
MRQPAPTRAAVVYLCTTVHTDPQPLLQACTAYAGQRGWRVIDALHDSTGQSDPTRSGERPALARSIEALRTTEASVLLVISPEMISTLSAEYAQVTRRVTDAGGFIHTMGWSEVQLVNRRSA